MAERTLALAPSSNISGASFNDETLELVVTFKSGGQYIVQDVSTIEAEQFETSSSAGKFYNAYFKDGKVVNKV